MNNIIRKQRELASINKLKAQRKVYQRAKCVAKASFWLFVLPVVIGNIAKYWMQDNATFMFVLLVFAAIAAILKVIFSEWNKSMKKKAARIQQSFDTSIFGMTWRRYWGREPSAEEINTIAHNEPNTGLYDWYEAKIENVSHNTGVLLCQIETISYDDNMKKSFYKWVDWGFWIFIILEFVAGGCFYKDSVEQLILYAIIPLSPLVIWYLYMSISRKNESELREKLIDMTSDAWSRVVCQQEISMVELVAIQDALLQYRQTGNAVPDIIYDKQRNKQEGIAYESVKDRLRKLGID